ncbi:heme export protein (ABC superfamily, membrane), cytochrome c-type biogenesis [Cupriavidus taiwanensis]|uniref:Heme exporter protein B n=2 Tax=Cupriavidus taiwanensis TaxID=164546 RepID=A0A375JAC1_9BURK|nr:heme export protein (ABC superfamily, membrane), cytochrome c-type biogenesis [Cupriavidus taiwanensis]
MGMTGMPGTLAAIVAHDVSLSWRRRGSLLGGVVFFVMAASLFPLAIGPEPQQLRALAPGILWVTALLASMLSLSRLFAQEHADGSLDQLLLSPHPLALLVLAKIAAHWLTSGLPLLVLTPLLAQQYGLPSGAALLLAASLLVGTPALSLIGAVGAALTLGLRGGAVLLCILVLPLCVPVLVFGAGAAAAADAGLDVTAQFSLLGACLALSLFLCPLAAAGGLRIAMETPA